MFALESCAVIGTRVLRAISLEKTVLALSWLMEHFSEFLNANKKKEKLMILMFAKKILNAKLQKKKWNLCFRK